MAIRSMRWIGLSLSATFAIGAVVLTSAAGQAFSLPGSPIPQSEMEDLQGATCDNYLICDTSGPLCGTPFVCMTAQCSFNDSCSFCYLGVTQGFCSPEGAGFFDTCETTTLNCGLTKYGYCDFINDQCQCRQISLDDPQCSGADCLGGC